MAKNLTVPTLRGKKQHYSFGWSLTDDISTVVNWQEGDNVFLDLDDGKYYVFAKPVNGNEDDYLRIPIVIGDDDCQLQITGFEDITQRCQIQISGYEDITLVTSYEFQSITGYNT
ncbi:hypothetical protein [Jiulongibacter sediminis]|uniref:hypothetical protein n=1 Tax=Jiulongibacter sediminis TaxID=1605367 RepID=UPI0026F0F573|nr:hypothetical protein [Jiulongibacter sediminis]